jgi:hypothetical protein
MGSKRAVIMSIPLTVESLSGDETIGSRGPGRCKIDVCTSVLQVGSWEPLAGQHKIQRSGRLCNSGKTQVIEPARVPMTKPIAAVASAEESTEERPGRHSHSLTRNSRRSPALRQPF